MAEPKPARAQAAPSSATWLRAVLLFSLSFALSGVLVSQGLVAPIRSQLPAWTGVHFDEILTALVLVLAGLLVHHLRDRRRLAAEIRDRLAEQSDARELALHDPLTGLLNRRGMDGVVAHHLVGPRHLALLLCDLNGFKQINDSHGHLAGDIVLQHFAARIGQLSIPGHRIDPIRLGGDEFVILVSTDDPAFDHKAIAREVLRANADPVMFGEQVIPLGVSIGVAVADEERNIDTLLEMADDAMYEAKRTGLPIRVACKNARAPGDPARGKLEQQLDTTPIDGNVYAAAIGIDRLNDIRRAFGYELGSKLVRELTHRLGLLEDDLGFERLSSNVLGVAFRAGGRDDAYAMLERIRSSLEGPLVLAGTSMEVRLTMGLAGPARSSRMRELTEEAQAALEQAWSNGAATAIFDEDEQLAASGNIGLMTDMRTALSAGAMEVFYQPKVHAPTGKIEGMEALVRWSHPLLGQVPPGRFVPIAEKTGNIRQLTDFVLDRALRDHAELVALGFDYPIYVNLSAELVGDAAFAQYLMDRLRGKQGGIGIEITETAVLSNPERALLHLREMAEQGIKIAIDDYGAGLSSLSYLRQLPATELKLDMMFIANLATSHRDPMIVRSTIDLAHGLGLKVTAEGVEDRDAVALLRVMGCDLLQGYLVARPMPLQDLKRFLGHHDPSTFDQQTSGPGAMLMPQLAKVA